MHIVADREIACAERAFAEFGSVELVDGRALDAARLGCADILLVRSVTRVDAGLLDGTPVRFVGTATAGLDHIDTAHLCARGITLAAAPGCNARAVAEHVTACVLHYLIDTGRDAAGLSAGIIGCGHAGSRVAAALEILGFACRLHDPPLAAGGDDRVFRSLEETLAADIVTLHVPLTGDGPHPTLGLLDARRLARVRDGGLVINTSRGGVIDEAALVAAIDGPAHLRAAIDCWQGEPQIDRALLARAYLATPHIAGHTREARINATAALHQALARHLGRVPRWRAPRGRTARGVLELARPGAARLAVLAQAVCTSDDPRAQTASLRRALARPATRVGACFDEVRHTLGMRREFSHYRVASGGLPAAAVSLLAAFGFRAVP